jgi:hypothetical protein
MDYYTALKKFKKCEVVSSIFSVYCFGYASKKKKIRQKCLEKTFIYMCAYL